VVGLNRGDGRPRTLRAGPEGSFRFDHLTPGWWRVEKRDEEILRSTTTTRSSPRIEEEEPVWNCEVFEGKTSRFDLRLEDPNACLLDGFALRDGKPLEGWTAWLCPLDVPFFDNPGKWPAAVLGPEGRFRLNAAGQGAYRLVLKEATAENERILTQEVFLGGPVTPWKIHLHTGTLVIEGMSAPDPGRDVPDLVYASEGECWFLSLVLPDAQGVCRLAEVPAGKGELRRFSPTSLNPRDWPVAEEAEILAGKETRIRAP